MFFSSKDAAVFSLIIKSLMLSTNGIAFEGAAQHKLKLFRKKSFKSAECFIIAMQFLEMSEKSE